MHVHLLENPSAGRGHVRALLARVRTLLEAEGQRVTPFLGEKPGDIARYVAGLSPSDADLLVIAGGDGTLRTVVNAAPDPVPWPIGLVPFGTANLVARETSLRRRAGAEEVVRAILTARPWPVDVLEVRRPGRPPERAVAVVSAGLDAAIVERAMQVRAEHGGGGGYAVWIAPVLETVRAFPHERLEIVVDGRHRLEATTVVVQNARSYGGLFRLSPAARLDSGRLEVVAFEPRTVRGVARLVIEAALRRAHRDRRIHMRSGRTVTIRAARPVPVQVDGDPAGTTDLEIAVRPGALRLLRRP